MKSPDIFAYTDSLLYLKDWFQYQKEKNPHFSYTTFSQKAGFKSRSFIQLVLKDQRSISAKSLFPMLKGLGLKAKEAHFFEALVDFRQAKSHEEKALHWERIRKLGKSSSAAKLRSQEFDFFREWYIAPLREIICNTEFKDDFEDLSQTIQPKITPKQAKDALNLLKDLKLIQQNKKGLWEHSDQHIHASSLSISHALREFQRTNAELASQALERFPRPERNISTITLGTDEKGFQAINQLISEFQENVVKIVEESDNANRVFQMNVQFFPLSKNFKTRE